MRVFLNRKKVSYTGLKKAHVSPKSIFNYQDKSSTTLLKQSLKYKY